MALGVLSPHGRQSPSDARTEEEGQVHQREAAGEARQEGRRLSLRRIDGGGPEPFAELTGGGPEPFAALLGGGPEPFALCTQPSSERYTKPVRGFGQKKVVFGGKRSPARAAAEITSTSTGRKMKPAGL